MGYFFHVFWKKLHSKLTKFRIKKYVLDCYIVSDLRFLLEIQAILPKTSPFSCAQMAMLSGFFQMFIVLGMYNFGGNLDQDIHFLISITFCRYVLLLSQPLIFLHKQLTLFLFLLTLEQFKSKHSILEENISNQYFTIFFKTLQM